MYEIIPYICAFIFVGLGLYMAFMPKQATKKELQDSEEVVKKTKRNGFIFIVLGIVLAIVRLVIG